jgi:hypothetical protein
MTLDVARSTATPHGSNVALARPAWLSGTVVLVLGCLALAALSLLLPSAPTYDPWAWLVWGREVVHLDLSTVGGPSWKPLPVLFTAPFSLFGGAAPDLWLVVSRAGALLAIAMAFRLARRLASPGNWGFAAGLAAAAALVTSTGFIRSMWPGYSEGLLIAFLLWAVESHLDGHRRRALVLGVIAALLRPESWLFVGAYGLWLAWRAPATRRLVAACGAAVLALWFLPELWGSGHLLRAAERANNPDPQSPAYAAHPAQEVVKEFGLALTWPLFALAGVAFGYALVRRGRDRDLPALALAGGGVAWLALVAVMTEAGYSGNPRYLMPVTAVTCVLAGVGLARTLDLVPSPRRALVRGVIAVAVVAAVAAVIVDRPRVDAVTDGLRSDADLNHQLATVVARAGGPKAVLACGHPITGAYQVPALAWDLHVHTIRIGLGAPPPAVVFRADRSVRMPPVPRQPPYHTIATAGRWQVYGACR